MRGNGETRHLSPDHGNPRWLADKIKDGQRKASPGTCPRCGTPILAGLDGDAMAFATVVEATPTTALRAAIAMLTGGGACHLWLDSLWRCCLPEDLDTSLPLHLDHVCQEAS